MSVITAVETTSLRAPVLVALVVVLIVYVITKQFAKTGCPFAAPARKSGSPPAPQMAKQTGNVRLTLQQLAQYDGTDSSKPLYIALRGKIYDVTPGKSFYGPGGPYAVFAGRECSRALAFMKITAEDCTDDLSGATESQLKTLQDWENKFAQKYGVAGEVVQQE